MRDDTRPSRLPVFKFRLLEKRFDCFKAIGHLEITFSSSDWKQPQNLDLNRIDGETLEIRAKRIGQRDQAVVALRLLEPWLANREGVSQPEGRVSVVERVHCEKLHHPAGVDR